MDFKELAKLYKNELLENVLPFWLNHSQDLEFGGYYTCLNRNGDVFGSRGRREERSRPLSAE